MRRKEKPATPETVQVELFPDHVPPAWKWIPGKHMCGRNPAAGPGSCALWWEMCPKAAERNCYLHWLRSQPSTPSNR